MKVRTKLTVGFLVIVSLIWITVFFALNTYTKIQEEFEVLKGDIIPSVIAMSEVEKLANEAAFETMGYLYYGEEETKQRILSATKQLKNIGQEHLEHETYRGQEEQKVAEELMVKINRFTSAVVQSINLKEQGMSYDQLLLEEAKLPVYLNALLEQIRIHKAVHIEELVELDETVREAHTSAVQALFLSAGLITLLSAVVIVVTTRSIEKPLRALHEGVEIIGQGNLDYKVGTKAKDEIGQLSRAFDQMTENLATTTTSIDNLNKEITERKRAEHELGERVKELNCLYGIANIAERPLITVDELYQEVVNLLPASWRYPEISCARIALGDKEFKTDNFKTTEWKQSSDIKIHGIKAGTVEVIYLEERPASDEGPFLKQERQLIDAVAEQLGRITERMRARQELQEKNEQLDAQNEELQSQSEELMAQQQEVMYKTKKLEEANVHLQEVDHLKSIFLASMSHELRTPLNSITGFTSLILQGMVGEISEEQREQLTYVNSSANHLLSLINDILDISKIEAGKVELEFEEFRLGDVATEVVETFSPTAKLKGIRLLMDISEGTTLFNDRRRLKQVLMNLVSNAVKFTDQGSVKVASRIPADDNLEISVIDTGIGIKKEDIGKLFVPFQQIDESLTKKHAGTGLGLYITRKILALLGGNISAKSKYGKGSEFSFTLPIKYRVVTKK